jgi:hypothetical protein
MNRSATALTIARTLITLCVLTLLPACTYSTGRFVEPGLRGKLIDNDTSLPVQGAIVYGYYATVSGSLAGGESIKAIVRVFEVETDANGLFEIPPWTDDWSITRGERRQRFPVIAIYKDGYKAESQNLASLKYWEPQTRDRQPSRMDGNTLDWTARPSKLIAAKTERERHNTLIDGNSGYASVGECGWENFSKLLWAQHVAWKAWYSRNLAPELRDANGYPKGTAAFPPELQRYEFIFSTGVDRLIDGYTKAGEKWPCADPRAVFNKRNERE